jgi:hypothetical protein
MESRISQSTHTESLRSPKPSSDVTCISPWLFHVSSGLCYCPISYPALWHRPLVFSHANLNLNASLNSAWKRSKHSSPTSTISHTPRSVNQPRLGVLALVQRCLYVRLIMSARRQIIWTIYKASFFAYRTYAQSSFGNQFRRW